MKALNLTDVLALYTRQQRIEISYPDMIREVTPHVVRQYDEERAAVVYSRLDATNADAVIRDEIAYFKARGLADDFEWKWFDYDTPTDLKTRLETHGFAADEPEITLVLDVHALPDRLNAPPKNDIRRITDPDGIDQVVGILDAVWPPAGENAWLGEKLKKSLRETPDVYSVYIAYIDGMPASAAWIDFHAGSDFAGLWGGSTLEAYRGRGLYTDLVAVRADEAIKRGVRYLMIDSSPMSRAILEKLGFTRLCETIPMMYRGE